ncbi:MAG: penicillin-binding protein 1A [Desulfomonilaceae bacterium]
MAVKRSGKKYLGRVSGFIAWVSVGLPMLLLFGLIAGMAGSALGVYLIYSKDLPKIPDLRAYRPKTVSTFYAEDGSVIGLFYKEKRFPIPLSSIPPHVINAFLAAEDARFFSHPGIDVIGISRAVMRNLKTGNFSQGASTITQQVTRNFILSKEKKLSRKIREAILSFRLEKSLSKQEILNLYLNEIYLGRGAYGIEAAARTYFGKPTQELTIAEAAMIAGLVSNPNKSSPPKNLENALKRREFVLTGMLRNNFITQGQFDKAMNETPVFRENLPNPFTRAPYFTEAVRQKIIEKYGAKRLYNEGLQVWTTLNPHLQEVATTALIKGADAWQKREHRPVGLLKKLKPGEVRDFLHSPAPQSLKVGDIVQAVVLDVPEMKPKKKKKKKEANPISRDEYSLALHGDIQFNMKLAAGSNYSRNDLLNFEVVEFDGRNFSLEQLATPPVQGAVVCIENRTGYIRALVGGLDFERSHFNRATQAMRQPGSAFKPVVYSAALEYAAYSPHTMVVDEPIAVLVNPREPEWVPSNSDGGFIGTTNLTHALALSRNIVAIKLLMDVGLDPTIEMARKMGIRTPLGHNLSLGLGSSEVTPLELTSAYTVFPNMGLRISPVMIKKVVDRFGNVLEDNTQLTIDPNEDADPLPAWVASQTAQDNAYERPANQGASQPGLEKTEVGHQVEKHQEATEIPGLKLESILKDSFPNQKGPEMRVIERAMSPQTAFLMVSMMTQTCVSGTAARVAKMGRTDLAGKTGTTDGCADAWFIGFNPTYTTGVWMGFDSKISLGSKEYGGTAALPVWMDFMSEALKKSPSEQYTPPPGIVFWNQNQGQANYGQAADLSGADFDPSFGARRFCSVDAPYFMVAGADDSQQGSVMPDAGGSMYQGGMRVLSPNGRMMGYASSFSDDRGRTLVYPESPYHDDPDYSELQESFSNNQWTGSPNPYHQGNSGYPNQYPEQVWGR